MLYISNVLVTWVWHVCLSEYNAVVEVMYNYKQLCVENG